MSDTAYNNILKGGAYGNSNAVGRLWFRDLTIGQEYQFQIWVHDTRGAAGRTINLADNLAMTGSVNLDYNVDDTSGSFGQYVTGTFLADDVTQIVYAQAASGKAWQLNAVQLRAIPEPGTVSMLGLGVSLTLLIRRKRNI